LPFGAANTRPMVRSSIGIRGRSGRLGGAGSTAPADRRPRPLTLGADPDEAIDYLAGTGVGRAVLDSVPDDQQLAALEAVRAVLADHHTQADGVRLGAAIWIVTADNPT
jgi:hypothetical protein